LGYSRILKRLGIDTLQFNPRAAEKGVLITMPDADAIISGRAELKEAGEETFDPQPIVAHLQVGDVPGSIEFLKRSALPTLSR
jgi:hypothetical protein